MFCELSNDFKAQMSEEWEHLAKLEQHMWSMETALQAASKSYMEILTLVSNMRQKQVAPLVEFIRTKRETNLQDAEIMCALKKEFPDAVLSTPTRRLIDDILHGTRGSRYRDQYDWPENGDHLVEPPHIDDTFDRALRHQTYEVTDSGFFTFNVVPLAEVIDVEVET